MTKSRHAERRDSHGRFKPDHRARNLTLGTAVAVGAVASAIGAALHFGLFDRLFPTRKGPADVARYEEGGEHHAPDLAEGEPHSGPHDRAPEAFRPDPTAAVPAADRESLRPATGPSPSMVEDRGAMRSQTAPMNG